MAEPSFRMSTSDYVDTANRAHESFLKKLRPLKTSDSSFSFSLSRAAQNLCMIFDNDIDELKGKLTHVKDLIGVVKEGFEKMKDLLPRLSEEDRDDLIFSQALYTQSFNGKTDEENIAEVTSATASIESEKDVVQKSMTAKETNFVMAFGKEETKCLIFKESLKKPKILPCLHVFCMHCLKEIGKVANRNPGDLMPCDRCGWEFTIPIEGFDDLENFEGVETVSKPPQMLDLSFTHDTCEACAEDSDLGKAPKIPPAVIYCVDCKKKLFAECRRYHKKLSKTHEVRDIEDPQNASAALEQLTIKSKTGKISMSYVPNYNFANVGKIYYIKWCNCHMLFQFYPQQKLTRNISAYFSSTYDLITVTRTLMYCLLTECNCSVGIASAFIMASETAFDTYAVLTASLSNSDASIASPVTL